MIRSRLKARIDAAQGRIPCDLILRGVSYLDVFSAEFRSGDIAIYDGAIVGLEPGLKGVREIDGRGKYLVPGFIDAHVHLESSLLTPWNFQRAVLPSGTTTAICDPHELANVEGPGGIEFFLKASETLALNLQVMMSSCVPATHFETNGGGEIGAAALTLLAKHPNALGLAEMMNVPGVLFGDSNVLEKIEAFSGRPIDGHCPLVRGQALSAYATAGITSCHESSELEEAREKLTKGIAVWMREGSVAKDLHTLLPLLTAETSPYLGFCTDDRNPLDIAHEGHVDFLVREAIRSGVTPAIAYRTASLSVAKHYGLDRVRGKQSLDRIGAIAPGYTADLILLGDEKSCAIDRVLKSGHFVDEIEFKSPASIIPKNSIRATPPTPESLEGVVGNVNVIGVIPGKIITEHLVLDSAARGVAKFSVVERYGNGSAPSNAYVHGFGEKFQGAIVSSVGHDSHNLACVGSNTRDMAVGLKYLIENGGGFCVVRDGNITADLPLPFGGLMSAESPEKILKALEKLRAASKEVGCELTEPFLQLAFLCLPVIPALKLTDRGLVDVNRFEIISVRAS